MSNDKNAGVEKKDQQGSEAGAGVEKKDSGAPQDQDKDTIDWKAIAEKEKIVSDSLRTALKQKRQLRNKQPEQEIEEEKPEDEDDSKPLTRADMRKMIRNEVIPSITSNKEDSVLNRMISNPQKKDLIRQFLDSGRIPRTGTSEEDIETYIQDASDLADSKANKRKSEEIMRIASQEKQVPAGGSSADRGSERKAHQFTPEQVAKLTSDARGAGIREDKMDAFIAEAWKRGNAKR